MTEPSRPPNSKVDTGTEPDRGPTTSTSRSRPVVTTWQKVVAIFGLLVLLTLGVRMCSPGGGHGPGQNPSVENQEQEMDNKDGGSHVPPPGVPEH